MLIVLRSMLSYSRFLAYKNLCRKLYSNRVSSLQIIANKMPGASHERDLNRMKRHLRSDISKSLWQSGLIACMPFTSLKMLQNQYQLATYYLSAKLNYNTVVFWILSYHVAVKRSSNAAPGQFSRCIVTRILISLGDLVLSTGRASMRNK